MFRPLKFSVWFSIVIAAVFVVAWLWIREYSEPGPYDLEPVNLVRNMARNSGNSQGISDDLVKKFVTDTTRDYKIYHNDKYGFEFEFPSYFKPVNINSEEFHGESNRLDWIDTIVYPQSPSGFEYVNQSGGFIFRYDAVSDKWVSTQSGVPLKFAPHKLYTDKNLPFYYVKTGDAAAVEEKAFIFNLKAKFVLEISVSRSMSYVDCVNPCPERKPLSDSETINQILSTFKFIE